LLAVEDESGGSSEVPEETSLMIEETFPSRYDDRDPYYSDIIIRSDSELESFIRSNNFTGNGTESDPFVISYLEIRSGEEESVFHISNTTKHLKLINVSIQYSYSATKNVTNLKIQYCENITLHNMDIDSKAGPCLEVFHSSSIRLGNIEVRHVGDVKREVFLFDIKDLTIDGLQSWNTVSIDSIDYLAINDPSRGNFKISNTTGILVRDIDNETSYDQFYGSMTNCTWIRFDSIYVDSCPMKDCNDIVFNSSTLRYSTNLEYCSDIEILGSGYCNPRLTYCKNISIHDNTHMNIALTSCDLVEVRSNGLAGTVKSSYLYLTDTTNASIIDNELTYLVLSRSKHCLVSENRIEKQDHHYPVNGFALSESDHNVIQGNMFDVYGTGLMLDKNSRENTVAENDFSRCLKGIHLYQRFSNTDNLVIDNHFNCSESAILIGELHNDRIYNNTMNTTGISFTNSQSHSICVDIPINNTLDGLPILSIKDRDMSGSVIEDDHSQYLLFNVTDLVIANRKMKDPYLGPFVYQSSFVEFRNLDIDGSAGWGFNLRNSDNITLDGCSIGDTGSWPVASQYVDDLRITDCNIESRLNQDLILTGGDFIVKDCDIRINGNLTVQSLHSSFINNSINISENRNFNVDSSYYLTFHNNSLTGSGLRFEGYGYKDSPFTISPNNTLNDEPILLIQDRDLNGTEIPASGKGQIILVNVSNGWMSGQYVDSRGHYLSFMDSNNITVSDMDVRHCREPVRAMNCHDLVVTNSSFNDGITVFYSMKGQGIQGFNSNSVEEYNSGIHMTYSNDNTNVEIIGNEIRNCTYPIYIQNGYYVEIENNTIMDTRSKLQGPDPIYHYYEYGVTLLYLLSGKVAGNRISGFRTGLYLYGDYTEIKNNVFSGNDENGIYIRGQNLIVRENDVNNNGLNGIQIDYHLALRVSDNDCSHNAGSGIKSSIGNGNSVFNDNDCSFCDVGIEILSRSGPGNIYRNNYIEGCDSAGIYIAESDQKLHSNTLVDCGFDPDWTLGTHPKNVRYPKYIEIPSNNTVNGIPVYCKQDSRDLDITGDYSQILLYNITGRIHDLEMNDPVCSLKILDCHDIFVEDSTFTAVERGISAYYVGSMDMYNITIKDSNLGMDLMESHINISRSQFNENNVGISCNNMDNRFFEHSSNDGNRPLIKDSIFTGNRIGIHVKTRYGSVPTLSVEENLFSKNEMGVLNEGPSKIIYNEFRDGTGPAILLRYSSLVVLNKFIDNNPGGRSQVLDNYSHVSSLYYTTCWYDEGARLGNYWSELRGPDYDGDGIIDIPYPIYAENGSLRSSDEYPLMKIEVLFPPDDFEAWSFARGKVHLTWKPRMSSYMELFDGYRIYRGNETVEMEVIAELDPYERTHWYRDEYHDYQLIHNVSYDYYLTTFKGDLESKPTRIISVIPDGDPGFITITSPEQYQIFTDTDVMVEWEVEDIAPPYLTVDIRLTKGGKTIERWYNLDKNESPLRLANLTEGYYYLQFEVGSYPDEYDLSLSFNVDTAPPNITRLEPEEGSTVGGKYFYARWSSYDEGSGTNFTRVKLDDGEFLDPAEQNRSDTYRFENIKSGPHTITVLAVDNVGRQSIRTNNFTVDLTPCKFRFIGPENGSYVNTREMEIEWEEIGNWSDLMRIYVNVKELLSGSSYRSISYELDEENRTIRFDSGKDRYVSVGIETHDKFDNRFNDYLNFTIDTLRPGVKMITENLDVDLMGTLEFEFTERVNPSTLDLSGIDMLDFKMEIRNESLFITPISPLEPGRTYAFSIEVEDRAGNPVVENNFNFTATNKGRLNLFLLSNETGHRINANIFLNKTDGTENVYRYFSSFIDDLEMGEWNVLITKGGFYGYETRITLEAGGQIDLGNVTLFTIPGYDSGPVVTDDDEPSDDDDDGDDDTGGEVDREKDDDEEVPYPLILIVLLIILGILFIVTLVRKNNEKEERIASEETFLRDNEE
jgi:hypothetical protein